MARSQDQDQGLDCRGKATASVFEDARGQGLVPEDISGYLSHPTLEWIRH